MIKLAILVAVLAVLFACLPMTGGAIARRLVDRLRKRSQGP